MQLFYIPEVKVETIVPDATESKHMVKVLRLSEGDKVQVVDGKGGFYEAELASASPKKCVLKVLNSKQDVARSNFRLHVAIAPTKKIDRLEWFLEKATEIGIDEITPILCEHSERKVLKPERLEKILISAMKQSLKTFLPKLNPLTPFDDFIAASTNFKKYIAHCHEGNKVHLKDVIQPGADILVLIGPEGDFSKNEVNIAVEKGFSEISLGSSRLRTETAGVAACHIANLFNE